MGEVNGPGDFKPRARLTLVQRAQGLHERRAHTPEPAAPVTHRLKPEAAAALIEGCGFQSALPPDDECLISSPDAVICRRLQEQTRIVLATLTPREQWVLRLRFGIAQAGDQPLEKTDDVLTPSEMTFIEATALRKLRHPSQGVRLRSVDRI